MKQQILAVLTAAALPLAAHAQGGPGPGPGPGGRRGAGPGANDPQRVERVEKRMRLARTLGLAEALDLDAPQALKLGEAVSRFDERRLAAHKQLFEAHQALRRAAQDGKASAADVEQAIQKALDARAQVQAIDKETLAAVTKDLSPEKRARAFLFLERFKGRFGPGDHGGPGPGWRQGRGGRGMGPGPGMGMGPGAGPMMGMGPGDGPMDDGAGGWDDDD